MLYSTLTFMVKKKMEGTQSFLWTKFGKLYITFVRPLSGEFCSRTIHRRPLVRGITFCDGLKRFFRLDEGLGALKGPPFMIRETHPLYSNWRKQSTADFECEKCLSRFGACVAPYSR